MKKLGKLLLDETTFKQTRVTSQCWCLFDWTALRKYSIHAMLLHSLKTLSHWRIFKSCTRSSSRMINFFLMKFFAVLTYFQSLSKHFKLLKKQRKELTFLNGIIQIFFGFRFSDWSNGKKTFNCFFILKAEVWSKVLKISPFSVALSFLVSITSK